jgi:hypothetical protein
MAAKLGNAGVMRELIAAKADQTAMNDGMTPIELLLCTSAVKQGNLAHDLAVSTADVNIRNKVRIHGQRGDSTRLEALNCGCEGTYRLIWAVTDLPSKMMHTCQQKEDCQRVGWSRDCGRIGSKRRQAPDQCSAHRDCPQ